MCKWHSGSSAGADTVAREGTEPGGWDPGVLRGPGARVCSQSEQAPPRAQGYHPALTSLCPSRLSICLGPLRPLSG